MPILYLASQAPLMRLEHERPFATQFLERTIYEWKFYEPANWIYDHTPFREPTQHWAELWGVGATVRNLSQMRLFREQLMDFIDESKRAKSEAE
jgi:hypothetical protein